VVEVSVGEKMPKPDSKPTKAFTETQWPALFGINLGQHIIQPIEKRNEARRIWPPQGSPAQNQTLVERIVPVLIETGFFNKTPYKALVATLDLCVPWDRDTEPTFRVYKGELFASRKIHYDDFRHMSADEFADFQTGIAAEIILAACKHYNLCAKPAQDLVDQFPIPKIDLSLISHEPSISLTEPASLLLPEPLSEEELVFASFNPYQWCVNPPFTETQLAKIGPDTLNICVNMGMPVDKYVEIANAMLRAPKATLRIQGYEDSGFRGSDLQFLKYFRYLHRVCLEHGEFSDLTGLTSLSPELIRLDLDLRGATKKPSLEILRHFKSLQSLKLIGHYEPLDKIPNLRQLRALLISEITLKDLTSLTALENLQSLAIADCKVQNLSALNDIGHLKYLGFARLPKIADLSEIADCKHLEYLQITGLNNLESLPSLANLAKLRRLNLSTLKRLNNVTGAAAAPMLEEILLFELKSLTASQIECFIGHPTLIGLRSDNSQFENTLALKRSGTGNAFKFSQNMPDRETTVAQTRDSEDNERPERSGSAAEHNAERELPQANEPLQELRIHIKTIGEFDNEEELVRCNYIEDRIEKILETDLLGRWSGHEVGIGYHTIFFSGPDSAAMYEELTESLKTMLTAGSYIELEDSGHNLVRIDF
jgi:Leucine-rich repeat (LRR) protein